MAAAPPEDRSNSSEEPTLEDIVAQLTDDAAKFNQLKVHL